MINKFLSNKQYLKKPHHMYLFIVSFIGVGVFLYTFQFKQPTSAEWVLIFCFIGAILLLDYYTIQLPPEGNHLSLDSAVYLSILFIYGINTTLTIFLISSLIIILYDRQVSWWKQLFNFSIYTLMLTVAYYMFVITGGGFGTINSEQLYPYIIALAAYFITNVILIGLYYLLSSKGHLYSEVKIMVKGTFSTYVITLLLSIVLGILLQAQSVFGLILFIGLAFLLSIAFKQYYNLYQDTHEKASIDHLTGLLNHGSFKEALSITVQKSRREQTPLCLALLDIDDFKKYNDAFGHLKGDQLLESFGALLKKAVTNEDYIISRYGGEEFAIIMPNTNQDEAYQYIDKLRKNVNDSYFDGVEILPYGCLSFSSGIVKYELDYYSLAEFIDKADQAMYYAKAQGKNHVHILDDECLKQKSIVMDEKLDIIEQQLKIFLSKDVYTYRHSKRVYKYAVEMCDMISLNESEKKALKLGALIHDIGKIEVPRDIINKKGKLEAHEWEIMKKHVLWGKEIVASNKELEELIPLVELHHERYDGKGYPYGLEKESIPKLARLLCVIDSFDAMTTERPYQRTKTFEEGIQELRACSGKQFDPQFVEPFIELIQDKYLLSTKDFSSIVAKAN